MDPAEIILFVVDGVMIAGLWVKGAKSEDASTAIMTWVTSCAVAAVGVLSGIVWSVGFLAGWW